MTGMNGSGSTVTVATCNLNQWALDFTGNLEHVLESCQVASETMEQFAIQVGKDAVQQYDNRSLVTGDSDIDWDSESDDASLYERMMVKFVVFLETCVGNTPGVHTMLVGKRVIQLWIEMACPDENEHIIGTNKGEHDATNALLATLLSLVARGDVLDADEVERVMLESWREGGALWDGNSLPLLLGKADAMESGKTGAREGRNLCERLVMRGSDEIRRLLTSVCTSDGSNHTQMQWICHSWSERAWRLLELCQEAKNDEQVAHLPVPSLAMIGLGSLDLWEDSITQKDSVSPHHLYLCLMYLLQHVEDPSGRVALLLDSPDVPIDQLAIHILLSLSDTSDVSALTSGRRHGRRCDQFLSFLGGREQLPRGLAESWCREVIKMLASEMQPVSMYHKLVVTWSHLSAREVAEKVKSFFTYYSMNRHKMCKITPAYHAEAYSPDDKKAWTFRVNFMHEDFH